MSPNAFDIIKTKPQEWLEYLQGLANRQVLLSEQGTKTSTHQLLTLYRLFRCVNGESIALENCDSQGSYDISILDELLHIELLDNIKTDPWPLFARLDATKIAKALANSKNFHGGEEDIVWLKGKILDEFTQPIRLPLSVLSRLRRLLLLSNTEAEAR